MKNDIKYTAGQEFSVVLTDLKHGMLVAETQEGFEGFIPFEEFSKERVDVFPGEMMDLFLVYYDEEAGAALLSLSEKPNFCDAEKLSAENGGDKVASGLALAADTDILADFYLAAGNPEKAEEKYKEAMNIRLGLDDGDSAEVKWNIAESYRKLGDLALEKGEEDKAMEIFLKGVALVEDFDQNGIEYQLHMRVGDLYDDAGQKKEAIDFLSQAASRVVNRAQSIIARGEAPDLGHTETAADLFYRLGELSLDLGDREGALRYYSFAETVFDEISKDRGTVRDHYRLSEIYWILGDLGEDEEMLRKADELLTQLAAFSPELSEITDLLEKVREKLN